MYMEYNSLMQTNEGKKYFGINWALTTICNYNCTYCHPDLHNGEIKFSSLDVVLKFIDSIFQSCETRRVSPYFEFGGGEVTYLAWFSKVLSAIHKRHGLVSIISNASTPLAWWKKHTPMLHSVSLSYHSEQIKSQNHFIAVAKTVADSPTTRLQLNVMMLPERFSECLIFAEKLRQQVDCGISLQPLYHGFGGGGISGRFAYTKSQEKTMVEFSGHQTVKNIPNPRGTMDVVYRDGSVKCKSTFDLLVNQQNNFSGWHCHSGIENIIITFDGDIYRAWCMQDGPIGSIYDDVLNLPKEPTICHTKICQCGPDICSSKSRVE